MPNRPAVYYWWLTLGNWAHRSRSAQLVTVLLLLFVAAFTAGSFAVAGRVGSLSILPSLLLATVIVGLLAGLSSRLSYRPNGLWWLSKSKWLWSQLAPRAAGIVLIALITELPYVVSVASNRGLVGWSVLALSISALTLAAFSIGAAATLLFRRLTPNPFLRTILVVLAAYGAALVLTESTALSIIETGLESGQANVVITVLLGSGASFIATALALQLAINHTTATSRPPRNFWSATPRHRLLAINQLPFTRELVSTLLFYQRDAGFQRQVALIGSIGLLTAVLFSTAPAYVIGVFGSLALILLAKAVIEHGQPVALSVPGGDHDVVRRLVSVSFGAGVFLVIGLTVLALLPTQPALLWLALGILTITVAANRVTVAKR